MAVFLTIYAQFGVFIRNSVLSNDKPLSSTCYLFVPNRAVCPCALQTSNLIFAEHFELIAGVKIINWAIRDHRIFRVMPQDVVSDNMIK